MKTKGTPFFRPYGNEIELHNESDRREKFSNIDCFVPEKTKERTQDSIERYSVNIYLERLSQNKLLRFPVKIRKDECPDFFIFNCDKTTTVLEETAVKSEGFHMAMTEFEKSPETARLDFDLSKLEKYPLSKGGNKKDLLKPNEEGWNEDLRETKWTDIILSTINKKTKKLNGPRFKTADKYELLIYSYSYGINIKNALLLLRKMAVERFNLKSFERNFHCVSVIYDDKLLYDVANEGFILKEVADKISYSTE
ncbi:MAG: hypothetical protein U9Q24_04505 [Candidatus Ratteibacteria bacterium]|nr:hypothetical protein [Candidatus Ratteibacteria bacterium]